MADEPRRKTRYRGERCTSKLTLNANLAELAHRFEALLPTLTPSEPWSERLDALPEAAQPAAKRFVALYQTARFGGKSADSLDMESALRALEVELRSGTR